MFRRGYLGALHSEGWEEMLHMLCTGLAMEMELPRIGQAISENAAW